MYLLTLKLIYLLIKLTVHLPGPSTNFSFAKLSFHFWIPDIF